MSLFELLVVGCFALPIFGIAVGTATQKYVPEGLDILVWLLIIAFIFYTIYTKFREVMEFVFDQEIIEIDSRSIRIERSGLGFKTRKEYPAENIRGISVSFIFNKRFNFF